jgi:hypothetical protein
MSEDPNPINDPLANAGQGNTASGPATQPDKTPVTKGSGIAIRPPSVPAGATRANPLAVKPTVPDVMKERIPGPYRISFVLNGEEVTFSYNNEARRDQEFHRKVKAGLNPVAFDVEPSA